MLKLSTKSWISGFNAQGSRGIIVAVQVGAVKIYVAAVEALEMDVQLKLQTIFTDNIKNQMTLQWVSYPKSSWN